MRRIWTGAALVVTSCLLAAACSGKADLDLSLKGEGLSPRGVISVISGKGQLALSKGTFYGLSPSVLKKAANTYLKEEIPDKKGLVAKLESDFRDGRLPYAPVSLPLLIRDGVLRIEPAELILHSTIILRSSSLIDFKNFLTSIFLNFEF